MLNANSRTLICHNTAVNYNNARQTWQLNWGVAPDLVFVGSATYYTISTLLLKKSLVIICFGGNIISTQNKTLSP